MSGKFEENEILCQAGSEVEAASSSSPAAPLQSGAEIAAEREITGSGLWHKNELETRPFFQWDDSVAWCANCGTVSSDAHCHCTDDSFPAREPEWRPHDQRLLDRVASLRAELSSALNHLGSALAVLSELHPDDRCTALDEALAFYNAARPDAAIEPTDGYETRLVHVRTPLGPTGLAAELSSARTRIDALVKAEQSAYQRGYNDGYRQAEFDCSSMGFDAFMITAGLAPLTAPSQIEEQAKRSDDASPQAPNSPDTKNLLTQKRELGECPDVTQDHWSDCATHNAPAFPVGKCDCGFEKSHHGDSCLCPDCFKSDGNLGECPDGHRATHEPSPKGLGPSGECRLSQADIDDLSSGLGVCPNCGKDLQRDHLCYECGWRYSDASLPSGCVPLSQAESSATAEDWRVIADERWRDHAKLLLQWEAALTAARADENEKCARLAELAWTFENLSSQTVTTIKLIVDAIRSRSQLTIAPEGARAAESSESHIASDEPSSAA